MPDVQPRKHPRQARSRATCDALVEACARVLEERGFAGLTTNHIAARAGVGIGSLYEFFPSREAILAELTQRRLTALRAAVEDAIERALQLPEGEGVAFLLERIVERVSADRELFRVLLREAPFLRELPETRLAIAQLFDLGALARARARALSVAHAVESPEETWLIGRMLASAVIDIALTAKARERKALIEVVARLAFRMLTGRDPKVRHGEARVRARSTRRRAPRAGATTS